MDNVVMNDRNSLRISLVAAAMLSQIALAAPIHPIKKWGFLVYFGQQTTTIMMKVLRFDLPSAQARLWSAEVNYTLDADNPWSQLLQWTGALSQISANVTYMDDPVGNIVQFNPYINLRWYHFPWDQQVLTTLAFGEGLSLSSQIPAMEVRVRSPDTQPRHFLNYLMCELTLAFPSDPNLQLVYRIHHRSGVFGMYNNRESASTAWGLGIRYQFGAPPSMTP